MEETLDEMHAPSARQSALARYGVGWRIYDGVEDHFIIGHSGGMDGVNTLLKLVPAAGIAVAILTNTNGNRDLEEQVVADILSVLLPTYAEKHAREIEQQEQEQTDKSEADFKPDAHLLGQWNGHVHTYEGDIPLTLWFKESGDVHAPLGTQLKTLVNKARFKEQFFEGIMMGNIHTSDASRYLHHLCLDLKQRDEMLTGAIIVIPIRERTPGKRLGMALSYWVELRKDH
ncbi:serine hydrolase [Dictyobacter formicarum]